MQPTIEQPALVKVLEVNEESPDTFTLWLEHEMDFQPGQFIMVWIPRLDEKPYTISAPAPGRMAVTVRRRGEFSTRLTRMTPGESVGVRGPYGRGFDPERPVIIVAGGCGIASVAVLKDRIPEATLIAGARSESELIFRERFDDMIICTDDGSAGHHGFPTDLLRPRLEKGEAKTVCTCGPEPMIRAVFDMCEAAGVSCQAGLERYMKCGFGICGQCACGEKLVCLDGPVFTSDDLRAMPEFGVTARLKSGKRVTIEEYANQGSRI